MELHAELLRLGELPRGGIVGGRLGLVFQFCHAGGQAGAFGLPVRGLLGGLLRLGCQLCDLLGRDVVGRRRFGDLIAKIPQLAAE